MIVPLTSSDSWLDMLQDVPRWRPPLKRTVVIAPHPDDETLGAGGLIRDLTAKQVELIVVAVTDGEGAYPDGIDIRSVRREEQRQALKILGVNENQIVRLGLPDQFVANHEKGLTESIRPWIDKDTHVLAPWTQDFHPDHEACGRAARQAAQTAGAAISSYFFWTWHRGTPDLLKGLPLKAVPLDRAAIEAKIQAVQQHESQLSHPSGEPILPPDLLTPIRWPFEVFSAA